MKCTSCGYEEVPAGACCCPVCGAVQPQPATAVACPKCGEENRPGARFCQVCGQPLGAGATEAVAPSSDEEEATEAACDRTTEGEGQPLGAAPTEVVALQAGEGEAAEAVCDRTTMGEGQPLGAAPTEVAAPLLEKGMVIGGRYRVIELLPAEEGGGISRTVAVADLGRCWACDWQVDACTGAAGTGDPTEPYCEQCGVELASPPPERRLLLRETVAPSDDSPLPPEGGAVVEGGWLYTPERQPSEVSCTPGGSVFEPGVRLAAGQATDPGQQRDLNEDSFLALQVNASCGNPAVGLFIVADGIGGYEGGEWASQVAVQVIAETLLRRVVLPVTSGEVKLPLLEEAVHDHLRQTVEAANLQIYEVRTGRATEMGATLTLALVLDNLAYVANVGDSRTYLWGRDGLRQVTADHSLVASLIAAGTAQPGEIYTHPQRNAIYRSLGDKAGVEVDLFTELLAPGNQLVLCCDGLWEMVRNEGIEEVLLLGLPPQAACDELVRRANQAGGEDNISVIVVRAENSGQTGR